MASKAFDMVSKLLNRSQVGLAWKKNSETQSSMRPSLRSSKAVSKSVSKVSLHQLNPPSCQHSYFSFAQGVAKLHVASGVPSAGRSHMDLPKRPMYVCALLLRWWKPLSAASSPGNRAW